VASKRAKRRPSRPSFKLPDSFKDRTTKSGFPTKPKGTGGVRGVRPGDTAPRKVLGDKFFKLLKKKKK